MTGALDHLSSAPLEPTDSPQTEPLADAGETKPRSQWQLFRRRFARHKAAMAGLFVLVLLAFVCYGAALVAPFERGDQNLGAAGLSPSGDHWFGTDRLGRDVLTEILYSGRVTLTIGIAVAIFSTAIGTLLGAWAGYRGGIVDQIVSRVTDLFLVVPAILIAATVMSNLENNGKFLWWDVGDDLPLLPVKVDRAFALVVILTFLGWMYIARIIRGQVLSIKEKEFVEAARAAGASQRRIILRHVLPNTIGVIVVNATLAIAVAVTAEATLTYLGFGLKPPDTSWGYMIYDARGTVTTNKTHLLYAPAFMLFLLILSVNFVGDGLRDAFEPRAKQESG